MWSPLLRTNNHTHIILAGSKNVYLVVKNEGDVTMKVIVKLPNSMQNVLTDVEVSKHKSKKVRIFIRLFVSIVSDDVSNVSYILLNGLCKTAIRMINCQ